MMTLMAQPGAPSPTTTRREKPDPDFAENRIIGRNAGCDRMTRRRSPPAEKAEQWVQEVV